MAIAFDEFLLDLCLIPLLFVIILIIHYSTSFSYWKSRNIAYISPKFPFGNVTLLRQTKFNSPEWFYGIYKTARLLKEKYIGLYIFTRPVLVIVDPDIVESILKKDSNHFQKLDPYFDRKCFNSNAHNLTEQKWKEKQENFTSDKMQIMFEMMLKYCNDLDNLVNNYILQDEPLDMIDIFEQLKINKSRTEYGNYAEMYFDSTVFETINYCLYELSKNKIVQNKLRDEIKTVLHKHNNEFSYNTVMDMTYLDQTIHEILRKYPPVPLLKREFRNNYKFPGINVTFEKGLQLWISILGLHKDVLNYPEPESFNPDRFTVEEHVRRHPFTYLPFGNETSKCLGFKFKILQIKVPLMILLRMFTYSVDPVMNLPVKFLKVGLSSISENRIYLQAKSI